MKRVLFVIPLMSFFLSCGGNTENTDTPNTENDSIASVDTIQEETAPPIVIDDHLQAILDKSDSVYKAPFWVDTNFVLAMDFESRSEQSALNYENGHYLADNYLANHPTEMASYTLRSFYEIDSLKAQGEYEDYVSSLDIGMMQHADAYTEGLLELDESNSLLLWSLTFGSYEACPYYSGTLVFGTLLNNYEVKNTVLLAEMSGGGDPPYWGDTGISSYVTSSSITTSTIDRSGGEEYNEETGEDVVEVTTAEYQIKITESGLEEEEE